MRDLPPGKYPGQRHLRGLGRQIFGLGVGMILVALLDIIYFELLPLIKKPETPLVSEGLPENDLDRWNLGTDPARKAEATKESAEIVAMSMPKRAAPTESRKQE